VNYICNLDTQVDRVRDNLEVRFKASKFPPVFAAKPIRLTDLRAFLELFGGGHSHTN
jgi:hypothetical protein